jgi:SAM-dependent methyltransferase
MDSYPSEYWDRHRAMCEPSAKVMVPLLVSRYWPGNIIDVGCAEGAFVKAAHDLGVEAVGVDGAVPQERLIIPREAFRRVDLESEPLPDLGVFDLVLCLEVIEHLVPEAGDRLIKWLCGLGDRIVFSAAAPGQGGMNHHNEQWPEYWMERFHRQGYLDDDSWLRHELSRDERVQPYYKNNILVFERESDGA